MSDFFYKERLGPGFSPVIKVRNEALPQTVVSAIDNLLSPSGNMFTRAETVRNLMSIEKLNLEETAKALSIRMSDVANKLRLLEFSDKEREVILKHGFSEVSALKFLSLDKVSRLYAMEYCHKNGFSHEQIEGYVDGVVNSDTAKRCEKGGIIQNVRKFCVSDVRFFFNSIDNVLRTARRAGFEIQDENAEDEDSYNIHIKIKKQSDKNKRLS